MGIAFWILIIIYILTILVKLICSLIYWRKNQLPDIENNYINTTSIVQPILSGDRSLEKNLLENLQNSEDIDFLWIIDKDDNEIKEIINRIFHKNPAYKDIIKIIES